MSKNFEFRGFGLGIGEFVSGQLLKRGIQSPLLDRLGLSGDPDGALYSPDEKLHRACRFANEEGDDLTFLRSLEKLCKKYPHRSSSILKWGKICIDKRSDPQFEKMAKLCALTLGEDTPSGRQLTKAIGVGKISKAEKTSFKDGTGEARTPTKTPSREVHSFPRGDLRDLKLSPEKLEFGSNALDVVLRDLAVFRAAAERAENPLEVYWSLLLSADAKIPNWLRYESEVADISASNGLRSRVLADDILDLFKQERVKSVGEIYEKLCGKASVDEAVQDASVLAGALALLLGAAWDARQLPDLENLVKLTGGIFGHSIQGRDLLATRLLAHLPSNFRAVLFDVVSTFAALSGEPVFSQTVSLGMYEAIENWNGIDAVLVRQVSLFGLEVPSVLARQLASSEGFGHAFVDAYKATNSAEEMEHLTCLAEAMSGKTTHTEELSIVCNLILMFERGDNSASTALLKHSGKAWNQDVFTTFIEKLNAYEGAEAKLNQLVPVLVKMVNGESARATEVGQTLARLGLTGAFKDFAKTLSRKNQFWQTVSALNDHADVVDDGSGDERPAIVLTDMELSRSAYERLSFPDGSFVYHIGGAIPDAGNSASALNFISGRKVNDDQVFMRSITADAEELADILVKRFCALVSNPFAQAILSDVSTALFATVRARLIGLFRQDAIQRCWLEQVKEPGARVIFIMHKPGSLEAGLRAINSLPDTMPVDLETTFFPTSAAHADSFQSILERRKATKDKVTQGRDYLSLSNDALEGFLVRLIQEQVSCFPKLRKGVPATLFVNRMSAKTVPGTMVPIMKRAMQDGDIHLLDLQSGGDPVLPMQFADDEPYSLHYASTGVLLKQTRKNTSGASDPIANWFQSLFTRLGHSLLPEGLLHCKGDILLKGVGFDAKTFAYLFSLRATFDELFDGNNKSVVFVSPGRSAEAYCAQHMAGLRGVLSVEVVNAWLSDQYTYARPRGDLVTALDDWTSTLLRNHFAIDQDNIRKLGTPRFDGVYARAQTMDSIACRKVLGIDNFLPTICVALQPIELSINEEILRGVFGALSDTVQANVLIKPHPREESQRLAAYEEVARECMPGQSGECIIAPAADIIDALIACEVCITAFSNVGVEAALCQRDTILCQFEGMDVPVRLDEMGLGIATSSPSELSAALRSVLTNGPELKEIRKLRKYFFANNQHYLGGDAADEIYKLRHEVAFAGAGLERPLIL